MNSFYDVTEYILWFSRLCRERGPDLGVRACVGTLALLDLGNHHEDSQRANIIVQSIRYKILTFENQFPPRFRFSLGHLQ
jgi:hypothetical protein